MPSNPKMLQRWVRFFSTPSFLQRVARSKASSTLKPIGSASTKEFCSTNTRTLSSVAGRIFAAWTASRRFGRWMKRFPFPTKKTACSVFALSARWEFLPIKAEVYPDASGRPTTVAKLDNTGVNGTYLTSEGKKGDAAWGTRGRWCNLSGLVGDEPVTITILDHPENPGFPTYWHARGYGLFAANPLGQKIFSNGKEELNFSLVPHASATFRYRVLISSAILTPEATEAAYKDFIATYH